MAMNKTIAAGFGALLLAGVPFAAVAQSNSSESSQRNSSDVQRENSPDAAKPTTPMPMSDPAAGGAAASMDHTASPPKDNASMPSTSGAGHSETPSGAMPR